MQKELFAKRLESVLEETGMTKKRLSNEAGIDQSIISRCLNKKTFPEADTIARLALVLDISAEWLWTGRGNKYVDEQEFFVPNEENKKHAYKIKKLSKTVEAGIDSFDVSQIPEDEEDDTNPIYLKQEWLQSRGYKHNQLVAMTVRGESMENGLHDGDVVIVNTADKNFSDGKVFAFLYEGELTIKRLKRDAGNWWLSSDNPDQRKYERKAFVDGVSIVGKVIQKISEVI